MSRTSRIPILLLAVVLGLGGRAFAADKAIIVSGQETPGDSGTITISFSDSAGHNYSESVVYGQYSTSAAIASAFGVMFSRDYLSLGLCAHDHLPIHLIFSSGIRIERDNGIFAHGDAVHRL
jgi:hypothetical protein